MNEEQAETFADRLSHLTLGILATLDAYKSSSKETISAFIMIIASIIDLDDENLKNLVLALQEAKKLQTLSEYEA